MTIDADPTKQGWSTVSDVPTMRLDAGGGFTPRALVDKLFSVAGRHIASADLLAIVEGGAEYVEQAAGHAAEVAGGLGCLVAGGPDNGARAGHFQRGESVAALLWHLQAHFEAVAGVSSAVSWAASELTERGGK